MGHDLCPTCSLAICVAVLSGMLSRPWRVRAGQHRWRVCVIVGREILKELDNGTRASIVYDAAGQILSVSNLEKTGDVISRFTYLYDPAGNRTSETREDGAHKLWTYDSTSQLISEEIADDVGTSRTTYVYDLLGNRLVLNVDGELTTSTYDAANRLQTAEEINGITTYTFDANGNQRSVETPSGDITTYSWSYENQLIQIEEPDDVITTQVYAPINRKADELRIIKETDAGITNFIWDDQNIIREVDELNSVDAEYTLNPQPYGNLVSQRREAESTFYNYDALGSTESLTDQAGTKTDEYTYSAFGKITSQSGSTENPYGWVGELGYYREPDGRIVIRQRDYTVQENRFRSEDPLKPASEGGSPYRYANNNPITVTDPSGEAPQWHHKLPQALEYIFIEAGFKPGEIHEPKWGWILDEADHRGLHGQWNSDWVKWYKARKDKGLPITRRAVLDQLRKMMGEKSSYYKYLKKGVQAVDDYRDWTRALSTVEKATRFKKLLKALGILAALLSAAGGIADACDAFSPATALADEEIQRLYQEALKALAEKRFEDARKLLFGKEEQCDITNKNPDGIICKLLSKFVEANPLLIHRAIELDAALRKKFSQQLSEYDDP